MLRVVKWVIHKVSVFEDLFLSRRSFYNDRLLEITPVTCHPSQDHPGSPKYIVRLRITPRLRFDIDGSRTFWIFQHCDPRQLNCSQFSFKDVAYFWYSLDHTSVVINNLFLIIFTPITESGRRLCFHPCLSFLCLFVSLCLCL